MPVGSSPMETQIIVNKGNVHHADEALGTACVSTPVSERVPPRWQPVDRSHRWRAGIELLSSTSPSTGRRGFKPGCITSGYSMYGP